MRQNDLTLRARLGLATFVIAIIAALVMTSVDEDPDGLELGASQLEQAQRLAIEESREQELRALARQHRGDEEGL